VPEEVAQTFRGAFAKGAYFNSRIRDRFPHREVTHEEDRQGQATHSEGWGATLPRMIPMRTSSVFKSRWMALIWAAGIIWFAYDFAGAQPQADNSSTNVEQPTGESGTTITDDQKKQIDDALKAF
jgi:hypothetical protein